MSRIFYFRHVKELRLLAIVLLLVLMPTFLRADNPPTKPGTPEWIKVQKELRAKEDELFKKQVTLRQSEIEILKVQLKNMGQAKVEPKAVAAVEAILELKIAELQLDLAARKARVSLEGARLVADDGKYLGQIGPVYESESILCSYGDYGATYSDKSIWCTYGKYGATYEELSPNCSYSTKPPKLMVGDTPVASVTVGSFGKFTTLSPELLKKLK